MNALFDVALAVTILASFAVLAVLVVLGAVAMFSTAYTWLTGRELLP